MRIIKRRVRILKKTKEKINLSSGQKTIDDSFIRDKFFFAEIRFALKTVESNYSQRSFENVNELFSYVPWKYCSRTF